MTISAIIAIAAICVGLVMWMRSRKSGEPTMPLIIPGLCSGVIGYNRERMDRTSAEEIARELLRIKFRVWSELIRIYATGVEYPVNTIVIDPAWIDPRHRAGIKCIPGQWAITMNPNTAWGDALQYNYRNAFAAELHSIIRVQLYGRDNSNTTFNHEDAARFKHATKLWQGV